MLRLVKADFYRLFHSKGFYLIFLLALGLAGVVVISESFSTVSSINNQATQDALDIFNQLKWNSAVALKSSILLSNLLSYLSIGLFIIVYGQEFSQKTYKNTLSAGSDRLTFILSKFIVLFASVLLMVVFYFGSTLIFAFIKYSTTGIQIEALVKELFLVTLTLVFATNVILNFATILLIRFSNTVISVVFMVVYPLVAQLSAQLIGKNPKWSMIEFFDLFGTLQKIAFKGFSGIALLLFIIINCLVLICSIIVSAWIFRKKEL